MNCDCRGSYMIKNINTSNVLIAVSNNMQSTEI